MWAEWKRKTVGSIGFTRKYREVYNFNASFM